MKIISFCAYILIFYININVGIVASSSIGLGSNVYISGEANNFIAYFYALSENTEADDNIFRIRTVAIYSDEITLSGYPICNMSLSFWKRKMV